MDSSGHTVTGWPDRSRPAHADRPWPPAKRLAGLVLGTLAVLGAVGLTVGGCLAAVDSSRSTPTSASQITVTPTDDTAGGSP